VTATTCKCLGADIPVSDPTATTYKEAAGSGLDGVVRVGTCPVYGVGTLLATGRQVLAVAHAVDDVPVPFCPCASTCRSARLCAGACLMWTTA